MFTDYKNNVYPNLTDAVVGVLGNISIDKNDYALYTNIKKGTPVSNGYEMPADSMTSAEIADAIAGYYDNGCIFSFHNPITGENKRLLDNISLEEEISNAWNNYKAWTNIQTLQDSEYVYRFSSDTFAEVYSEIETEIENQVNSVIENPDNEYVELLEDVVFGSLSESDSNVVEWYTYRQQLKAMTESSTDFPETYIWPTKPTGE